MLKRLIVIGIVLSLTGICYADNSVRIKELQEQAQKLLQMRQQTTEQLERINQQLLRIDGGISELQRLDSEAKDEPKPE